MCMSNYTRSDKSLPREGVVVETVSPSGEVVNLKLLGNLWFLADGSMYVYYVPVFWRALK